MIPWTAARQTSLSIAVSWSLLKCTSLESVMPSNHLILCRSLLLSSIFPSIRFFSNELALHIISVQFSSVAQSYPTLWDPMDCSTPGLPVYSIFWPPFFTSGGQIIGVPASASVLSMNIQDWFPLGWTRWISLQSKGLSRVFSNTTVQKHQFFGAQLSLWSSSRIHTWLLEKP